MKNKILKQIVAFTTALTISLGMFTLFPEVSFPQLSFPVFAETTVVESGSCGRKVTWKLDSEGLLTISGVDGTYIYDPNIYIGSDGETYGPRNSPFYYNTAIKEIIVETGISSLGDYIFAGCSNLVSIFIPETVTSIGSDAFRGCNNISSIFIPETVTSIGNDAFTHCKKLREINIPSNVEEIGEDTFYYCTNLETVTIDEGVTSIGSGAFAYCSNLKQITIPKSVTSISKFAFDGTDILICGYENSYADNYCKTNHIPFLCIDGESSEIEYNELINPIVIKQGKIGDNVNYVIESNGLVTISGSGDTYNYGDGSTISTAPLSPFNENYNVWDVVIEDGVTSIGNRLFYDCRNLKSIKIADSVTTLGEYVFSTSPHLTSVEIPPGVTSLNLTFHNSSIASVTMPEGVIYTKNTFWFCSKLKDVILPNSITTLDGTFKFSGITNVNIPKNVTALDETFYNCKNLSEIVIPDNVIEITYHTFAQCPELKSVTIPASTVTIHSKAFEGSDNVTIHGYKNSYAETYANENNIPFVALDGEGEEEAPDPETCTHTNSTNTYNYYNDLYHSYECGKCNTDVSTFHVCVQDYYNGEVCTVCGYYTETGKKPIGALSFDSTGGTTLAGLRVNLDVNVSGENSADKLIWTTSNDYLVTVTPSADGRSATIYTNNSGTVEISVYAEKNPAIKATYTLVIDDVYEHITLTHDSATEFLEFIGIKQKEQPNAYKMYYNFMTGQFKGTSEQKEFIANTLRMSVYDVLADADSSLDATLEQQKRKLVGMLTDSIISPLMYDGGYTLIQGESMGTDNAVIMDKNICNMFDLVQGRATVKDLAKKVSDIIYTMLRNGTAKDTVVDDLINYYLPGAKSIIGDIQKLKEYYDLALSVRTNVENKENAIYIIYYLDLLNGNYSDYVKGVISDNYWMPYYNKYTKYWANYLYNLGEFEEIKYSYTINCPVNVEIYDASGNLMLTVTDEMLGGTLTDYAIISVYENGAYCGKTVDFFKEGYNVKIVGTADGTMDFSYSKYADDYTYTISEENIPVGNGVKYDVDILTDGAIISSGDKEYVNKDYTLEHLHIFISNVAANDSGHWFVCDCGVKSQTFSHTSDNGTIINGVKTYFCTVCGYTMRTENAGPSGSVSPSYPIITPSVKIEPEEEDDEEIYEDVSSASGIEVSDTIIDSNSNYMFLLLIPVIAGVVIVRKKTTK